MTTREVLEGARNAIRMPGDWCQGTRHSNDGRHCIVGAIQVVDDANKWESWTSAYNHPVVKLLARMVGEREIQTWNDARDRQHPEVLELLNLAIADEIAREDYENKAGLVEEIVNPVLDKLVAA